MIVANYDRSWGYLSHEHRRLDEEVQQLLNNYATGLLEDLAYAIIGTYGVGKTQFLYHVHQCALKRDIVPLYFLAEDLFREVITDDGEAWLPGTVYSLIEGKISQVLDGLSNKDASEIGRILDPRGKMRKDSPRVIAEVIDKFSGRDCQNMPVLLLVDELEGQYGILQEKVETMDRSPLRDWLESRTHLKFLAFAPAGIYELGGADRGRVKRKVIPPADVKFVRDALIGDAGRSNACWWLSRGKARQLFKTAETLERLGSEHIQDAARASRVIKLELDPIGQPPTEVPPAVTDKISPSKIPFLLNLAPIAGGGKRQYIIGVQRLDTGKLAEKLIDAFGIGKDNAILISEYFKRTVSALSDAEWLTYIDQEDLPELFCLVLDHFLEYEHGSPELSETFGEILSLYERSKKEPAGMYGTIGTLWELRESKFQLPLSVEEIREAFPFPTMNPMVKHYVPGEMKKQWEGRDLPLWKWAEGNVTILFFASARDFAAYLDTDEFLSSSLPDGKGVLSLLPYGEDLKKEERKPLFRWLEENGKLKVIKLQHLLTDFLFSASGELADIPGNLDETLEGFREDKGDILLSRKTEIYYKALCDTTKDELPRPRVIYRGDPPDAATVWGKTQMGHRSIAVSGIALAFYTLKPEEQNLLVSLRELFRGGKEGRGIADLRHLISGRGAPGRGGHTRLPDRLLPYSEKGTGIRNTEYVERLRSYWRSEEMDRLVKLARILSLNDFLKLHQDEDVNRLLEALWRSVRKDFEAEDLDVFIAELEQNIIPVLQDCQVLDEQGSDFDLSGIDFGDYERLVKSLQGFEKFLEVVKASVEASPLVHSIVSILAETITDIDGNIRTLNDLSSKAKRAIEDLKESAQYLKRNFWEYERAVKFIGLEEKDIKQIIEEKLRMSGTPDLQALEESARERKGFLDDVSTSLSKLDRKLRDLGDCFASMRGVE